MKDKNVYVIAGPNGSGKTTFAKKFLPDYAKCQNFVNADFIAQGLSPFSPRSVAIKAGRLLLGEIHNLALRLGLLPGKRTDRQKLLIRFCLIK